jgi:hypothetical protein
MNILIYPAGTEIGLELNRALRYQKGIKLYGANSLSDHSKFYYDSVLYVPDIYDEPEKATRRIKQIIEAYAIDFVFPAHDQVVLELSRAGIKEAILPERHTVEICRSKRLTYEIFQNIIQVPKVLNTDVTNFPVFCKPDCGQGTRGTFIARNENELKKRTTELILEYLPGEEFTVDCFTDRHGKLRYCKGRKRARITNGISTRTEIVDDTKIVEIGIKINSILAFRGQWFFQVKKNGKGEYVLMEIAARAAGASCLVRARGVNLPLLTLWDRMNKDIRIIENKIRIADRALENKYIFDYDYDNVYVDLDDTLIPVNYELIGLLYKFKKQGKNIYLITAHEGSVVKALKDNFICRELFTEVYRTKKKFEYINNPAIFIDDSFTERSKVSCPAFDVQQAIEVL